MTTATENHTVTFTKIARRKLRDELPERNLSDLLTDVLSPSLKVRGWDFIPAGVTVEITDSSSRNAGKGSSRSVYEYTATAELVYVSEAGQATTFGEVNTILNTLSQRAAWQKFGSWTLATLDGEEWEPIDLGPDAMRNSDEILDYAKMQLPDEKEFKEAFAHLYGLDAHITRTRRAIEAGIMTAFKERKHVALIGPPGCGKSDIADTFKRLFGEEAVMEFDSTNMTQSGAVKQFAQRPILPRVVIFEEIEKAPAEALNFLLSLMDDRAEIRKVTAREEIQRETRILAVCTVNNEEKFDGLSSNAISSRFSNKVYFDRPDRQTLAKILHRQISEFPGGDYGWIEPALDFCDAIGVHDPRAVLSHCLCGREMLLDGSYQEMVIQTSSREIKERYAAHKMAQTAHKRTITKKA